MENQTAPTPAPGATGAVNRRKSAKRKKIIIGSVVGVLLAAACAALILFLIQAGQKTTSTTIVTYQVQTVTSGSVDTTISGSGNLSPVSETTLTASGPVTVTAVNYSVGDEVAADAVIATVQDEAGTSTDITAPYDCILLELPVAVDDELDMNGEIAMVMGKDGFTLNISVDETDISTVALGQEVAFTIDAVDGEQSGTVSAISYNGTSSGGSVVYQITAKTDYIEGVYPGMSASAEIVIESSGEGLLVPADAVYTSGDESYVYLAPSDAQEGGQYAEEEIDLTQMQKVTVTTGMSDGSYQIVTADELSEGTLILLRQVTSTQTESDSDSSDQSDFGGMGGMGGFGGMEGGDMDFGSMDPSSLPQQGGGNPGGGSE